MDRELLFVGDKIFAPTLSHKTLEVVSAEIPNLSGTRKFKAINEYGLWFYFDGYGFLRPEDKSPSVFLATQTNKTKIKELFGIDISTDFVDNTQPFHQKLKDLVDLAKDFYKLKDNYNGSYYQRKIDAKMYEILSLYRNK